MAVCQRTRNLLTNISSSLRLIGLSSTIRTLIGGTEEGGRYPGLRVDSWLLGNGPVGGAAGTSGEMFLPFFLLAPPSARDEGPGEDIGGISNVVSCAVDVASGGGGVGSGGGGGGGGGGK